MSIRIELDPKDGHKSFYGKCYITISKHNHQTLWSYGTKIMERDDNTGEIVRFPWTVDGKDWTATTGRHIKAFCGLNKAAYFKLPLA